MYELQQFMLCMPVLFVGYVIGLDAGMFTDAHFGGMTTATVTFPLSTCRAPDRSVSVHGCK